MGVEQVTGPEVYHGEGPVWYPGWGGLRFVDMLAGDVMSLVADGSLERRHVGSVAAAVRPRRGGGAVIGVERGFALEDADGTLTALPELWSDPGVRMNEGGCDLAAASTVGRWPMTSQSARHPCTGSTRTVPSRWC
jgi:sugar lactone lactonase YvrE